jgi:fused signal recognition particle receptor
MSKFFKWLKKDKQQEESPVVDEAPLQTTNKHVNSEPELIEKNNSDPNQPITKHSVATHREHPTTARKIESNTQVQERPETDTKIIVNNYAYNKTDLEYLSEKSAQHVKQDLTAKTLVTEKIPSAENTSLLQRKSTVETLDNPLAEQQNSENNGFFNKLKRGLSRTKESIGSGIVSLFRGKAIDDELFEELETQLLMADVGMNTTVKIIQQLTESSDRKQLKDGDALYQLLKEQMTDILEKVESPLTLKTESGPFVILMVGVNGVGKTTTIGKMAKQFQQQGKKVMLAAGDTFRAAAVEQLEVWGERNNIPVVAQQTGSDSASVIFDAFQSAKAKNVDVLIADTAGRLQNKEHLMEELKKVVRVMKKISPQAPHEIMLTLDAGTGQNAVSQTKLFNEAVGLTGISLTKLDGTAKGGVIFAIADQFDIPIRYVGIGEGIDDLRPFNSQDFVNALFTESDNPQEQTN